MNELLRNEQVGNLAWQQEASVRSGKAGMMDGGIVCTSLSPGLGGCAGMLALAAHTVLIGSQVCYHHGNNADPEERDCPVAFSDVQDIQILSRFVRDHLPDLQPKPAVMERCMYTVRVWAGLGKRGRRQIDLVRLGLDST